MVGGLTHCTWGAKGTILEINPDTSISHQMISLWIFASYCLKLCSLSLCFWLTNHFHGYVLTKCFQVTTVLLTLICSLLGLYVSTDCRNWTSMHQRWHAKFALALFCWCGNCQYLEMDLTILENVWKSKYAAIWKVKMMW